MITDITDYFELLDVRFKEIREINLSVLNILKTFKNLIYQYSILENNTDERFLLNENIKARSEEMRSIIFILHDLKRQRKGIKS